MLDPFAGSHSTEAACDQLGLECTSIEWARGSSPCRMNKRSCLSVPPRVVGGRMSDIHMQAGGSPPPGGVLTECGKIIWHPDELKSVVPQARGPVTCKECIARSRRVTLWQQEFGW